MGKVFTNQQLSIIREDINANLKVIAVPGSGKSTVLIYRVEYLLDHDINPNNILVIMFNDSAAVNFRTDLKEIDYIQLPEVKTYHSFAMKLCKKLSKNGYLSKELSLIADPYQYKNFYRGILIQVVPLNLQKRINPKSNEILDDFVSFVELVKSTLSTPEEVFKVHTYSLDKISYIEGYHLSEKNRNNSNIQFFSDLIFDVILTVKKHPECRRLISNMHQVILVDEYQDSNALCHEFLKLIAGDRAKVNVVGDDDQTIYDFTGASPEFLISTINDDFDHVKFFSLSYTFRYGHSISLLANNVIHKNKNRIPKLCISGRDDLFTEIATASYDATSIDCKQVEFIEQVSQWILGGGKYNDIAILIRNYQYTFGLEIALLRHGIPYFIGKQKSTVLHSNEATFLFSCVTVLSEYEGIPEKSIRLSAHIFLTSFLWGIKKSDLNDVCASFTSDNGEKIMEAFNKVKSKFKPEISRSISKRIKGLIKTRKSKNRDSKYLITRLIKECSIISSISKFNWKNPLVATIKFKAIVDLFCSLDSQISLVGSIAANFKLSFDSNDNTNKIEITTLHRSKGLAWPLVIMAYCEENILPSSNAFISTDSVEVERRLYFVGVTRAKQKLVLHIPTCDIYTQACISYKGKMNEVDYFKSGLVSRFVYESNILSATKIAYEIYKDKENSSISNTDNRDLYNMYLFTINKPYRISGLKKHD